MSNGEAINIIECAVHEVEWEYSMDYAIAFDKAIEALEKQIPKKPIEGGYEGTGRACPNCGNDVGYIDALSAVKERYCDACGQAILWEDE